MAPRFRFLPTAVAGADQRREVGLMRVVDRRRHGDDDEVGLLQCARHRSSASSCIAALQLGAAHLAGGIDVALVGLDLLGRQIEADRRNFLPNSTASGKPT